MQLQSKQASRPHYVHTTMHISRTRQYAEVDKKIKKAVSSPRVRSPPATVMRSGAMLLSR